VKRILIIIALSCLFFPRFSAQEITDPEELFSEGEFFFLAGEYQEALYYYLQLQDKFPDNANFNFKVGMTYLQIPGQEHRSIPYLEKAITQTSIKYKKRLYTESNAPHYAYYYLGNAYRINNELDKALETYQTFMDSEDFEGNYNLNIVETEVRACERAKIIQDVPINLQKTRLDPPINTETDNYAAVLSADGNTMVFITQQKFYDAIMLSRKVNGIWTEPEVLNPQVGSDGDMYPTSLSSDGSELYLVKRTDTDDDIYLSVYSGPFWSKAQPLNENINTRSNETHASISGDGQTLYFTSDRRGGYGKLDIYRSQRLNNNEWGPATNMGPVINTDLDEETPFITMDGKRLYFSSKGHFNMGGYDIFFTDLLEDNTWNDAINIGFPLNTTGDDLFYFPVGNGEKGYYAIRDKEEPYASDIYYIEILERGSYNASLQGTSLFRDDFNLKIIDMNTQDTLNIRFDHNLNRFSVTRPSGNYKTIIEK
jgi:Tol biopolymer transport system component